LGQWAGERRPAKEKVLGVQALNSRLGRLNTQMGSLKMAESKPAPENGKVPPEKGVFLE